jgi:D-psicose/D-tagatose/L-ribulose 3-epimerase
MGREIETGGFLLDPRAKHEPTLVSPEVANRAVRIDLLRRAIAVAEICGAEAASFRDRVVARLGTVPARFEIVPGASM